MAEKVNIDLALITSQILEGMTIMELKDYWKCSRTTITEFKKANNLVGLSPNSKKSNRPDNTKECNECLKVLPISDFYSNGFTPNGTQKYKAKCKTCSNLARKELKRDLIFGYLSSINKEYKCEDCGDSDSYGFLDFHHIESKDFEIGHKTVSSSQQFYSEVVPEVKKCILLCPSCHRRRHM